MKMRDETLSSVGAQSMRTSGYRKSKDSEFHPEVSHSNMDPVFQPGIDTPSAPLTFKDFELGSMAENLILMDEEQDKENSPCPTTTPVSERPNRHPVLMTSCPFGTGIEKFPDYVYRNVFE